VNAYFNQFKEAIISKTFSNREVILKKVVFIEEERVENVIEEEIKDQDQFILERIEVDDF